MSNGRRYAVAWLLGSLAAALLFVWMLNVGRADFFQAQRFGGTFFDEQARALADGHWDLPTTNLGPEAYIVDGKAYIYFGPVPALLRFPILALTDNLDGRLTQVSMLAAWTVAMFFAARLGLQVRRLIRGEPALGTFELWAIGLFALMLGAGSSLLFLASRAWVYHETLLWGVAFSIAAYDTLLRFLRRRSAPRLVAVALLSAAALLTRPAVGLGPTVALGVVSLGMILATMRPALARRLRDWGFTPPGGPATAWVGGVLAAGLIPVVLYASMNYIKFEQLFGIPFETQTQNLIDETREETLAASGGTLFNVRALPTTTLQMIRPDALRPTRLFPFVEFPPPAPVIGDVKFDLVDRAASLPVAMPVLVLLSIGGLILLIRPRRVEPEPDAHVDPADEPGAALLRAPVIGAAVGGATSLIIIFVANRYTADFVPLLLMLGLLGGHWLFRRREIAGHVDGWTRAAAIALVALVGWSVYVNGALALTYQRLVSSVGDLTARAELVDLQVQIDDLTGGEPEFGVGEELPVEAGDGDLFVIGQCDGLYRYGALDVVSGYGSDWTTWAAVERTPATGRYRLAVTFPDDVADGTSQPLLTSGTRQQPNWLAVEFRAEDEIAFAFGSDEESLDAGTTVHIELGREYEVDVIFDRRVSELVVTFEDRVVLNALYLNTEDDVLVGRNPFGGPVERRFTGEIEDLSTPTPICDELVD
ncbi:MAG: hypothetical protein ACRDWD_18050 [Acidimicrobiia bacterium]